MGQDSAGTYQASPSTLSKRGSHLCNDAAASVLIRSDNDAVASPLIGISATMLSHLLLRSQPRWKVCADAQSGRAATASQSAEMQGSGEPLARSGTSKGEAPPHHLHTAPVPTRGASGIRYLVESSSLSWLHDTVQGSLQPHFLITAM